MWYQVRAGRYLLRPARDLQSERCLMTSAVQMRFIVSCLLLSGFMAVNVEASDKIGKSAPVFGGMTAEGEEVRLEDYRGKVVVLDFWASWCGPCREELPFLMQLAALNKKKNFQLITVNIDDKDANMVKFLSRIRRQSDVLIVDRKKAIPALYDIQTMPTTVFIDRKCIVRYWHDGFTESDRERYEVELGRLLAEK